MVKTALVLEVRGGRLYIFMPPTSHFEHYLAILTRIESVAKELSMPLLLKVIAHLKIVALKNMQ